MTRLEVGMWANVQALAAAVVLLLGGVVLLAGRLQGWPVAAPVALFAGVLLFFVEWSRPRRNFSNGQTPGRRAQRWLQRPLIACGPVVANYLPRALFYVALSIPCALALETLPGALLLLYAAALYFVAFLRHEYWRPCEQTLEDSGTAAPHNSAATSMPRAVPRRNTVLRDPDLQRNVIGSDTNPSFSAV